jgi:hypothetical protein
MDSVAKSEFRDAYAENKFTLPFPQSDLKLGSGWSELLASSQ